MNLKLLLLTLSSSTLLFGQCTYNLDVNFDFQNKTINVQTDIKDTQKSLLLDIEKFDIKNKSTIKEKLKDGTNKLSFEYSKKLDKLNENYIYLLNNWYPTLESNCSYTIETNLSKEYKTVYENTKKEIDSFNFIASKDFIVRIKKYNDITLKTYFLKDDKKLVERYFDKTIEYIKLYESKIAKFPYKEFKIVENIYQTGYSMPTFTLIGSRLLGKDYILNQSLGHEILHQYFGNSIFTDFKKGNWIEGLTTYLADDYYKKLAGKDIENRKVVLNQYDNFVNDSNEFAIDKFRYRYDKASSLIGYSKLAFVFHMLEKKLDEEKFNELIKKLYTDKKFTKLDLKGLVNFFEENSQVNLEKFFNQWLYKKGQIDFKVQNIKNYYDKGDFYLELEINQDKDNFYKFDLPLEITTYDEKISKLIPINESKQTIKLNFSSEILDFTIDKNYDLFRKLSKKEKFPAISELMTQKELIAVVNKDDAKKYKVIERIFPNAKLVFSENLKFKDIKNKSLIFLDASNELLSHFYPNITVSRENSYLMVKPHIYDDKKVMAILNFGEYKTRYLMMLKHFSQYSKVVLSKDFSIKEIDSTPNGIEFTLNKTPLISKVVEKSSIKNIYEEIKNKKIIYVGESHTSFEHHLNQLRVIKSLHENGKDVAIALEMFQKPFQKDLDEYIEGKTSLNEFLKNSQYYKRWVYDYNLYKPIIDYAKKNKIPLVAINIDRKINKKVRKESLLGLSTKEKEIAPKYIDQSNLAYKEELDKTFKQHIPIKGKVTMDFDKFYQSQLIWDETMAENIDNYIKANPKKTVVVLAGSGHIEKHNGIPSRVFRRNGIDYEVVINNPHKALVGDIVILNKSNSSVPQEKKLGVALIDHDNLTVIRVVDDSYAKKLGVKEGDKIIKLNDEEVNSIADIKRVLYLSKKLKEISVTVKRKKKILELKNM